MNSANEKKAQFLERVFTRDGSKQNLWLAKLSFLSCIDDVAHHCQFTASAQLKAQKEHEDIKNSTKYILTPQINEKTHTANPLTAAITGFLTVDTLFQWAKKFPP